MCADFEMPVFVSKCVAEFGTAAVFAVRSGHAPKSELSARVRGEYALSFVEGEFDFTVAEMVSGVFPSCERAYASSNMQLVRNAVCTPLAASDMLDICVVEIEEHFTRLVVGAIIAAMISRRSHEQRSPITSIPDALLARIANLAIADLRRARSNYVRRREIAEQELNESVGRLNGN
jgi:hypothetical protein